ncbi:MAG: XRE family transcriptional regulator [Pseudomonadota bacterium]
MSPSGKDRGTAQNAAVPPARAFPPMRLAHPMTDGTDIGERLRTARRAKGLKLKDVARLSGLSISQLSKLENGHARLTVDMALMLAGALAIPANHFFSRPGHAMARGRRSVTRAGTGIGHTLMGMDFEVLCSDFADKRNLNWRVRIHGRSLEECGGLRSHSGEEFITVLSGTLTLHSEYYEPLALGVGDSIVFDGEMVHGYAATGEGAAVVLMSNSVHE